MKPTLIRLKLIKQGGIILRPTCITKNNESYWVISNYTGKAWSVFSVNRYKTQELAQNDIDAICKQDPEKYYNDKYILESSNFLSWCKEERNNFVTKFLEVHGSDTKLRVMAENLLIAFDQLVNRVETHEC